MQRRARHVGIMVAGMCLGAGVGTTVLADRMITGGSPNRDSVGGPPERETASTEPEASDQSNVGGAMVHDDKRAEPFTTITARDLARRIDRAAKHKRGARLAIFDGNSADHYANAHIPGAVLVADAGAMRGHLPKDRKTTLVFVCVRERSRTCEELARAAAEQGYKHVAVVSDGIEGWTRLGRPLEGKSAG